MWLATDAAPSTGFVVDPAFWLNLGVAGVVLGLFIAGKLHSPRSVEEMKAAHKETVDYLQATVTRLLAERDRAQAERDAAYEVVGDFNHLAAGVIQKLPTISPDPRARPRPRRGESERP